MHFIIDWNCREGPLDWTASISWGFSAKFYPEVRENEYLDYNDINFDSDFMVKGQRFGRKGKRCSSHHSEK